MHLQTVMQAKGIIESQRQKRLREANQVCRDRESKHKASIFPIDDLFREDIISQAQYKAALYYRYLFDRLYQKKSSCWMLPKANSRRGQDLISRSLERYEAKYVVLYRELAKNSKKASRLVNAVVLYDQAIATQDHAIFRDGLEALTQYISSTSKPLQAI